MHFVDKIFPGQEKKKAILPILLVIFVLLLPALLKLIFPNPRMNSLSGTSGPIWGRFIFAHLLFLVQVFFFFLHPACRKLSRVGRWATGLLLLYLLGCLLSPWLTGCTRSFQELIKLFSASSLFFLFLYYSNKGRDFQILRVCAILGCVLMSAEALLGLGQYVFQSDLGQKWLGEKPLSPGGSCASIYFTEGLRLRPYGTFGHPNHFGGFLVVGFLLTCYLITHHSQKSITKILLTLALTLQSLALTATFSRSAWLGAVFGLVIFMALRGIRAIDKTLFLALIISTCSTLFVFHDQIIQRCFPHKKSAVEIVTQPVQYFKEQDIGIRGEFQAIAQNMILSSPWYGIGFQEFVRKMPDFASSSQLLPVHNIYLLVAAELGLPAALAFTLFFIFTCLNAIRNRRIEVLAAIWLTFAFIGVMDNYFLTSQAGRFLLFAAAAIVLFHYDSKKVVIKSKDYNHQRA